MIKLTLNIFLVIIIMYSPASYPHKKAKRGVSGYGIFLKEHLSKLALGGKPFTGVNASQVFVDEWKKLSEKEREEYEKRSTQK
jgi:hypothetical protein